MKKDVEFLKKFKKSIDNQDIAWYYKSRAERRKQNARVVELADSLDSGSSVQYARAGSSPASRTKETVERLSLFYFPT